eukprot:95320-Chlamydomonas_euryale.AAC.6
MNDFVVGLPTHIVSVYLSMGNSLSLKIQGLLCSGFALQHAGPVAAYCTFFLLSVLVASNRDIISRLGSLPVILALTRHGRTTEAWRGLLQPDSFVVSRRHACMHACSGRLGRSM